MAGRDQGFTAQLDVTKVRNPDYTVNRQTEPLVDSVNRVVESPLLGSTLVSDVELRFTAAVQNSAVTEVRHKLGKVYRGFMVVCNTNVELKVSEDSATNDRKDTFLNIIGRLDTAPGADTTIKISVLIF